MAEFMYYGTDAKGAMTEGVMEADDVRAVYRARREAGEVVYSVEPVGGRPWMSGEARPLGIGDLSVLTEQLGSLTASGVPLAPALGELAKEMGGRRAKTLLETLRVKVEGGSSLEEALEGLGDQVPPLYRALVRVGERTGNLPEVLRQLTAFGQRYMWLRHQVQIAVLYPAILFMLTLLFLGVFVPHVLTQFDEIYASFGRELPPLTQWVLWLGQGLLYGLIPASIALLGAVAVVYLGGRRRGGSLAWERIKLSVPFFGPIYRTVLSARFLRALSLLLAHGAPIVESLHLAGLASNSTVFLKGARRAAAAVSEGNDVSDSVAKGDLLKRSHGWMLRQGERNGNFTETLTRLADICDRDAERLQRHSLSILGPSLVAVCGVLVGLFVVASFVPVFQFPGIIGQ